MTLRLLLVRHGLSSFNRERRVQGRNDLSNLTDEGQQQALRTGEVLKEVPIHAVYSSPLTRAKDTAKSLLLNRNDNCPKISFDDGLLEVDLGPWSGMTIEEVESKFPNEFKKWRKEPRDLVLERKDGSQYKPIEDLMTQAKNFLSKLLNEHQINSNKTILIVAHNAVLRCLVLQLLNNPKQGLRRLQLDNASLSILNLKPSKNKNFQLQIECLNSTTHLTPQLPPRKNNARVILVRHGETDWNLQGRFQGQIDIPLNKNGHQQAKAAGSFLSQIKIDRAFSSSMNRPRQTAEAIMQFHSNHAIESKEGLIEIGHGLWEGKLESEIKKEWPELLEAWQHSPEAVQMPQGETIQDVWSRSVECWRCICKNLNPHETALVVAHDAVNKTILCNLLGLTPSDIWMIKQGNGGVTVIDISKDEHQPDVVTCLNLTSHLGGVFDCTAAGAL